MKVTERSQRVNGRPHLKKGVFPNWLQTGSVLPRAAPVLLLESPNGLHVKSVVSEINLFGTGKLHGTLINELDGRSFYAKR